MTFSKYINSNKIKIELKLAENKVRSEKYKIINIKTPSNNFLKVIQINKQKCMCCGDFFSGVRCLDEYHRKDRGVFITRTFFLFFVINFSKNEILFSLFFLKSNINLRRQNYESLCLNLVFFCMCNAFNVSWRTLRVQQNLLAALSFRRKLTEVTAPRAHRWPGEKNR